MHEDNLMDIHKPKSWPAWRIMLADFVIVVLGVGVALAAQQAAEWWNWRGQVTQARAAIRAEMAVNNLIFYAFRVEIAPCVARKTDEAEAMIAALQVRRALPPLAGFRSGLRALLNDSEWQTARASQVLTHFPRGEMTLMSTYYTALQNQGELLTAEGAALERAQRPAGCSRRDHGVRHHPAEGQSRHGKAHGGLHRAECAACPGPERAAGPAPDPARSFTRALGEEFLQQHEPGGIPALAGHAGGAEEPHAGHAITDVPPEEPRMEIRKPLRFQSWR